MSNRFDIAVDLYESLIGRRVLITDPVEQIMIDRLWPSIIEQIKSAQKFVFDGEINPLIARAEEIKENAHMMAQMNLFHLPYYRTYYEYTERFETEKYERLWAEQGKHVPPGLFQRARNKRILHGILAEEQDGEIVIQSYAKIPDDIIPGFGGWQKHPSKHYLDIKTLKFRTLGETPVGYTYSISAVFFLVVLLGTAGVDTELVYPPRKLNKVRIKRGRSPFFEHKIVRLNLEPSLSTKGSEQGERKPPRMHIRRGHIRFRDQTPDKWVWIKPTLVGMIREGMTTHTYKVGD